jgi:beta-lactamase regulating signal transducer with metallopeptidase domain
MEPVVRWLLTYLVHSTLLLGASGLARLALRERRLALQEALLRAALVGGFVTSSLQVGLAVRPLGGSLALPESGPAAAVASLHASPARPGDLVAAPSRASVPPAVPAWVDGAVSAVAAGWRGGLALAWAALATLALVRLGVAALRLRRLLRGRRPIDEGALAPLVARLGRALGLRHPVRLSAADRLSVPLATGVLRPEVCLPTRAVAELPADEQAALCAHELAHVARRDPAWILLARLAAALAPLQPLNAWARRRLQDLAECLSDDLAVAAGGRPLGLARSLVDIASWTLGERSLLPVAAAGALSARCRLGHRVERLMDPARPLERPRRFLLPLAAAAVLATALVSPVVSGSAAPPAPEPQPSQPAQPSQQAEPSPKAEPAPEPRALTAETRERLEQLSRQIADRTRRHEAEMKKLEAEVQALASKIQPDRAELERLSRDMEKAARELAESASADRASEAGQKSERTAEAARRVAELEDQLRATTRAIRIPPEELRALREKAHALAELARPTADEMREIRRLSAEAARLSAEQARLSAEQARDARRLAREALRQAREELRRAMEPPRD